MLTGIGYGAFYNCKSLSEINIPATVKYIGDEMTSFSVCGTFANTGLLSIILPSGIHIISSSTFQYCNNLVSVTVPNNVKVIGHSAFASCTQLQEVILNEGLEEISENAFCNCDGLKDITIPKSVNKIGNNVFSFSRLCQPDRRYNPWIEYDQNPSITIHCYPGSFSQEFFRGKIKCVKAD